MEPEHRTGTVGMAIDRHGAEGQSGACVGVSLQAVVCAGARDRSHVFLKGVLLLVGSFAKVT